MKNILALVLMIFCSVTIIAQKFKFTDQGFKISTKIENANGHNVGSGIFFEDSTAIYLISARHVFLRQDSNRKIIKDNTNKPVITHEIFNVRYFDRNYLDTLVNKLSINFEKIFGNPEFVKYNEENDLIAIKIATIDREERKIYFSKNVVNYTAKGFSPSWVNHDWIANLDDVLIGTDVWIIGYPETLNLARLDQYNFDLPLLQKGIVSGKYEKRGTMVINAPVYPGNSGGPVFGHIERNEMKLIGIAVEFIPLVEKISQSTYGGTNQEWTNSGYTVVESIDKIMDLIHN